MLKLSNLITRYSDQASSGDTPAKLQEPCPTDKALEEILPSEKGIVILLTDKFEPSVEDFQMLDLVIFDYETNDDVYISVYLSLEALNQAMNTKIIMPWPFDESYYSQDKFLKICANHYRSCEGKGFGGNETLIPTFISPRHNIS